MKKLFTSLLIFFTISMNAQLNEVKLDGFGFLLEEFNVSYERFFEKKIGIEIGVGYTYEPERLDTVNYSLPLPPGTYGVVPFKKRAWSFLIAAKYYLFPNPVGNRLYLGTYVRYRTKPKIEDAYFDAYEKYFNTPDLITQGANLSIGGMLGYKILFKQKIVLEPAIGMGIELGDSDLSIGGNGPSFDAYVKLNLGYRFGTKNEISPSEDF